MYTDIKKQFIQQPESVTVEAGRSVTLRCVPPAAAPVATLKWTRNGVTIEPSDEILVLPKVALQVSELGYFKCIHKTVMVPNQFLVRHPSSSINKGVQVSIEILGEH